MKRFIFTTLSLFCTVLIYGQIIWTVDAERGIYYYKDSNGIEYELNSEDYSAKILPFVNRDPITGLEIPENNSYVLSDPCGAYSFPVAGYGKIESDDIVFPATVEYNNDIYTVVATPEMYNCSKEGHGIIFPNTVTEIGSLLCSYMSYVVLPSALKKIEWETFAFCQNLNTVYIPESVEVIGLHAFLHCESLPSINIPANVKCICEDVFGGCYNMKTINVDVANQRYTSVNGALYTKMVDTLLCVPAGQNAVTLPTTVEVLGAYAMHGCRDIEPIEIHENIKVIGENAFIGCSALNKIVCLSSTPPSLTNSTFTDEIKAKTELIVPTGLEELYRETVGWKDFKHITGGAELHDCVSNVKVSNQEPVYDLVGRSANKERLHKGVYIRGNKKYLIK